MTRRLRVIPVLAGILVGLALAPMSWASEPPPEDGWVTGRKDPPPPPKPGPDKPKKPRRDSMAFRKGEPPPPDPGDKPKKPRRHMEFWLTA